MKLSTQRSAEMLVAFAASVGLSLTAPGTLSGVRVKRTVSWSSRGRRARLEMSSQDTELSIGRRSILRSAFSILLATMLGKAQVLPAQETANLEEAEYKGPLALGFRFMYPSAWSAKKKPIKTHVYEVNVTSPDTSSTTVGVVVDPVKITSIEIFGSPKEVGDKVIAVERKKDGVTSADLIRYGSTKGDDGLTHYIVEYKVDSSRGQKHFVAKATITGGQLFVLTAQAKEANFSDVETILNRIVETFQVQRQYT